MADAGFLGILRVKVANNIHVQSLLQLGLKGRGVLSRLCIRVGEVTH